MADGLWSRATLLNVVAYRVWQDQSPATENLLQSLLAERSADADVRFYLGKFFHRRGDLELAKAAYGGVLDVIGLMHQSICGWECWQRLNLKSSITPRVGRGRRVL